MEEIETWRCRVACAPLRKEKSDKSKKLSVKESISVVTPTPKVEQLVP